MSFELLNGLMNVTIGTVGDGDLSEVEWNVDM